MTQKERWRSISASAWNGGVLSTAGNLVFQGNVGGEFVAYDASRRQEAVGVPGANRRRRGARDLHDRRRAVRRGDRGLGRRLRDLGRRCVTHARTCNEPRRVLVFKLGGSASCPSRLALAALANRRRSSATRSWRIRDRSLPLFCSTCHGARISGGVLPTCAFAGESHGAGVARNRDRRREGTRMASFAPLITAKGGRIRSAPTSSSARTTPTTTRQQVELVIWSLRPQHYSRLLGGDRFRRGLRNPRCMPSCK